MSRKSADLAAGRRKTVETMGQILELRREGFSDGQACGMVGITLNRLKLLRSEYPEFGEAMRKVRARRGKNHKKNIDDLIKELTGAGAVVDRGEKMPVPPGEEFRQNAFNLNTPPHLAEIHYHLTECDCTRLLVLVPPEHAKTTLIMNVQAELIADESYRHSIGEDLPTPLRMATFSETSSMAETMGWQLRQALTDADMYSYLAGWGPFRTTKDKWTAKAVYMPWRSAEEKEPTAQWLGIKNQIQGARLTHAFLDDVDSPGTAPSERAHMLRLLDHTIARRVLQPVKIGRYWYGKLVVAGTRVDELDFYSSLLPRVEKGYWHCVIMPAVKADGSVTWDRYTTDFFDKVRGEMANDALYNLVYQQIAVPDGTGLFDPDTVEGCKRHDLELNTRFEEANFVTCAIDPALEGPWAAEAMSYNPVTDKVRPLDILAGVGGGYEAMDRAVSWCLQFRPNVLAIEKTGGMSLFVSPDIKRRVAEARCLLEFVDTGTQGMNDATYGFSSLAVAMRQGRFEIPFSDAALRVMGGLVDEFLQFRLNFEADGEKLRPYKGRKDKLMATWFNWRMVLRFGRAAQVQTQYGNAAQRAPWVAGQQRLRRPERP